MKLNKRSAGAFAIVLSVCLMLTIALLNNEDLYAAGVRAGLSAKTNGVETAAVVKSFHKTRVEIDASATETDESETDTLQDDAQAESVAVDDEWSSKLMADVGDKLNVRADANTDAEVVGLLRRGDVADILGESDGWYEISSGDVTGYVSSEYCISGESARELAEELTTTKVTSLTGALKVRSDGNTDASVVTLLYEGQQVTYDDDAQACDGWVAVKTDDGDGYVSSEYVTVSTDYSTAITIEEARALEEKEAAAKASSKSSKSKVSSSAGNTSSSSGSTSGYDDETLLAALIQFEAGSDTAEGKLAVGAVVMNRVKSSAFPNSIHDVIYQSGQFPSAAAGGVAKILASGVSSSARSAAQSALAGTDNTGGLLHFQPAGSGHSGTVIGAHVFY